jgi:hypothetical protein
MALRQLMKLLTPLALAIGVFSFPAAAKPLWPCLPRLGEAVVNEFHPPHIDGDERFHIKMRMPNPEDPMPRGGSYAQASAASDLSRDTSAPQRIFLFDPGCDSLVLDGQPLSEANLPRGVTITESSNSMILLLPNGGAVILRGIRPALWREGVARQIHGTRFSETLTGTEGPDVFSPGWGRDTVIPGAGDDSITYARGDLTIANQPPNLGQDLLDLRRFRLEDLQFFAQGPEITIKTPNGKIHLPDQRAANGNIEMILLQDEASLSAAELAALIHD